MICEDLMMKIYMWGTGRIAGKVLDVYMKIDDIEGFIDNSGKKDVYMGKKYSNLWKCYNYIMTQ